MFRIAWLGSNWRWRAWRTGFLADSEEQWVDYLSILIKDHDLRLRMSHAAAGAAMKKYSLESNTPKIIEAFQAALN